MLTLSFIVRTILGPTYDIHNSLQRLLGYLILFVPGAFVPQRQFRNKRSPAPLPVRSCFKYHRISTLHFKYYLLLYDKLEFNFTLRTIKPSRYPLNLIKMNNTSLLRIAATAGT